MTQETDHVMPTRAADEIMVARLRRERWCKRVRGLLGTLLAAGALTGCGGGGGGEGGGGGSTDAGTVALNGAHYPLRDGDLRHWRTVTPDGQVTTRVEHLGAARPLGNLSALPQRDSQGGQFFLARTGNGIVALADPADSAATPSLLDAIGVQELLRFGLSQGQTAVLLDKSVRFDIDGNGQADDVGVHVELSYTGNEDVSTPAGSFPKAARVHTVSTLDVRLAGQTGSFTVTVTVDDWYALNVGPVRSTAITSRAGFGSVQLTEELVSYSVGGRRSESVAPALLGASPADGDFVPPTLRAVLDLSEAPDPLSLDGPDGVALLDARGAPLALAITRGVDERQLVITPLLPLVDGVYTLHSGAGVTDLAGNPLAPFSRSYRVDTHGPTIVASQPAAHAPDAPLTGTLVLQYSEPLLNPTGAALGIILTGDHTEQRLPARLDGDRVTAELATPLTPNRDYDAVLVGPLVDAAGNAIPTGHGFIQFHTDPGPLVRPVSLAEGQTAWAQVTADLDGDGRRDIVYTGRMQDSTGDEIVGVRLQKPDGSYTAPQRLHAYTSGERFCGHLELVVLDVDGDGLADIVLPNACSNGATVLRQGAGGRFSAETVQVPDFVLGYTLRGVDLDGRGQVRLAGLVATSLNRYEFIALRYAGTPAGWVIDSRYDTGIAASGFRPLPDRWLAVDLDGDGLRDLVWLQYGDDPANPALAWALRGPQGLGARQSQAITGMTFPSVATTASSAEWPLLTAADLDGDGRPELLLCSAYFQTPTRELLVWRRSASGGYAEVQRLAAARAGTTLVAVDADADGRLDMTQAHDSSPATLGVYSQGSDGLLLAERLFELAAPVPLSGLPPGARTRLLEVGNMLALGPTLAAATLSAPASVVARRAAARVTSTTAASANRPAAAVARRWPCAAALTPPPLQALCSAPVAAR